MSTTSEHLPDLAPPITPREDTPGLPKPASVSTNPNPPPPQKTAARNKRGGGRKTAVNQEPLLDADGVPVPPSSKRQGNGGRSKNSGGSKRPPQSNAGDIVSRRGQASGAQAGGSNIAESSRAHRNTHAYMVSQQPLYTSWNLPDYLAHLESLLPTDVPRPLEVVSGIAGRESIERTTERGVKVKWPSKRMSVVDMNKRVRALVEWVGREQASASDRARRREVLEKAVKENALLQREDEAGPAGDKMVIDSTLRIIPPNTGPAVPGDTATGGQTSLMKDMEKLMTDLITFQERFGPGAKSRERRHVS